MPINLFSAISQSSSYAIIAILLLALLAWNITLHWQIHQATKKIKAMFKGTKAEDLESIIFEQIKRLRQTEKTIQEMNNFSKYLERMCLKSIQKVGIVRYNPFRDMGGDQSFSIALLDAKDSGVTISSLFTREGTRVYTKPIKLGQSKHQLTEEEQKAIEEAIKQEKEPIEKT